MKMITYKPIGVVHTPFLRLDNMPIQPVAAEGVLGTIELRRDLVAGLKDLDGFSHIILLYHLHEASRARLTITPFLDDKPRGVFATRAPRRPNPIALSLVQLLRVEQEILHIRNVDILDGTPLLDIKPYIPEVDSVAAGETLRLGWIEPHRSRIPRAESDNRFA
jgi:tRNA-Thr(GGU) m(6)t(6)A37 methyltransferase TsaA